MNYLGAETISGTDKVVILMAARDKYAQVKELKLWENYFNLLMAAYIKAITQEGYPPFVSLTEEGRRLSEHIRQMTGLSGSIIMALLMALYETAQAGRIDPKWWTPSVVKNLDPYAPRTEFENFMENLEKNAPGLIKSSFGGIITAATIAAIVIFAGPKILDVILKPKGASAS